MIDFEKWIPDTDWVPQFDLVTGKVSKPAFRLEINNKDISGKIQSRLMSLTLTDNRGLESDQLDIELDDADGMLVMPRRGNILTLELGWHGYSLTPKGKFVVDEIEHVGAPDRLTIRARSADFRGDLNVKREASYHKCTLGSIVSTIAARNKLAFKISSELENIAMHIDQTNESDVSFLTRLAKQEGAIASVKNGELLFVQQGQNKTVNGKHISPVLITRKSGDNHRFSLSDREAYTGVVAQWMDTRTATKQAVKLKRMASEEGKVELVVEYESGSSQSSDKNSSQTNKKTTKKEDASSGKKQPQSSKKEKDLKPKPPAPGKVNLAKKNPKTKGRGKPTYIKKGNKNKGNGSIEIEANFDIEDSLSYEEQRESTVEHHQTTTEQQESASYLVGTQENILTLSHIYSNKESAERAAIAVWKKMQRGAAQFSITLALGRADIYPETPIQLEGFKPEIDETDWTLVKVTHTLNNSGFTTSLDLEIKIDEFEMST
ncbi:phage late control D family protein [Xenorhabdus thuongxuanensis]|uniref:Phage protein n=1 Tax=Xenorhabdus thuongxuanensis TaxID=1873484 RepID=A0A1Q5TTI2_9GAMM|nr:phage late control D family protein [Xenorhabdus thuongxuanensis]OKP03524.1 phage protein [Xenorhabdus thuongxuanensis]